MYKRNGRCVVKEPLTEAPELRIQLHKLKLIMRTVRCCHCDVIEFAIVMGTERAARM